MLWKRRNNCAPQAASTPHLGVEERKALRSVEHEWQYLAGKVGCIINTVNKPKNTKNNAKLGKSVNLGSYLFHGVAKRFKEYESHGIFWGDVIDASYIAVLVKLGPHLAIAIL